MARKPKTGNEEGGPKVATIMDAATGEEIPKTKDSEQFDSLEEEISAGKKAVKDAEREQKYWQKVQAGGGDEVFSNLMETWRPKARRRNVAFAALEAAKAEFKAAEADLPTIPEFMAQIEDILAGKKVEEANARMDELHEKRGLFTGGDQTPTRKKSDAEIKQAVDAAKAKRVGSNGAEVDEETITLPTPAAKAEAIEADAVATHERKLQEKRDVVANRPPMAISMDQPAMKLLDDMARAFLKSDYEIFVLNAAWQGWSDEMMERFLREILPGANGDHTGANKTRMFWALNGKKGLKITFYNDTTAYLKLDSWRRIIDAARGTWNVPAPAPTTE